MRIAILGTGAVGRALGRAFTELGHEVVVGTRDPEATTARADWDPSLRLQEFAAAAAGADVVVNALRGQAAPGVLAGLELDGRVVLDVTNPLDFSQGFPPTLAVKDTDSLAEQIQRAVPGARVVKTLNTTANEVMVAPYRVGDGDTTIFVAGDDADARAVAKELLGELGWKDIVEFERLEASRGLEMWLPLWIRLVQKFGRAEFNLKIVR
jgi:predicted dinucleotide-binding enzyme